VLDAGNALFRAPGLTDASAKTRAAFVMKQMGALGTKAMAPGVKDLNLGLAFLTAQAKASGVKLLSANLMKGDQLAFDAAAVFPVGQVKVGVIGLSPEGPVGDVKGEALAASVEKALPKVKDADVRVVLAAVTYDASLKLAEALGSKVDFIIQSDGGRGALPAQKAHDNFVLPSGVKGQQVGRLDVSVKGPGPLVDEAGTGKAQEQLAFLDRQLDVLDQRIKLTRDPSGRRALKETTDQLRRRRDEVKKEADAAQVKGARAFRFEWEALDSRVPDEPAMKAKVLKIEPTYSGTH